MWPCSWRPACGLGATPPTQSPSKPLRPLLNFGGGRLVRDAANLRFVRHGAEYRAETVSLDDAQDAIDLGAQLLDLLEPKVEQILTAS